MNVLNAVLLDGQHGDVSTSAPAPTYLRRWIPRAPRRRRAGDRVLLRLRVPRPDPAGDWVVTVADDNEVVVRTESMSDAPFYEKIFAPPPDVGARLETHRADGDEPRRISEDGDGAELPAGVLPSDM